MGAFQHIGDRRADERLVDAQEKSAIRFPIGCAGGLASQSAFRAEKPPQRSGFGGSEWSKLRHDTNCALGRVFAIAFNTLSRKNTSESTSMPSTNPIRGACARIARESEMHTISSIKPESMVYCSLSPNQNRNGWGCCEERERISLRLCE
jgi:hypothetical protein